jgi:hypothetical protein
MNCTACAHPNPERTKFCLECGTPAMASCAGCGSELPMAAKFCGECGTSVEGAAPDGSPASPPDRAPRDYTPKHLADKRIVILAAEFGWERCAEAALSGAVEAWGRVGSGVWDRQRGSRSRDGCEMRTHGCEDRGRGGG